MTILDKILADKKIEVAAAKQLLPLKVLKQKVKNFKRPQVKLNKSNVMGLIAEIKPKSPSAGVIRKKVDIKKLAKFFEAQGASAISVLTDKKYFGGSLEIFSQVRKATRLPLLRKEFIIDIYQVYESALAGADIVLLIASALKNRIPKIATLVLKLGMQPLIEVHNQHELRSVLKSIKSDTNIIIGINNRDLKTFNVDLMTSLRLAKIVPDKFLKISESGVFKQSQLKQLQQAGFDGVLIGTGLVKNPKLFNFFSHEQA